MITTQGAGTNDRRRPSVWRKVLGTLLGAMGVFAVWNGVAGEGLLPVAYGSCSVFAGVLLWTTAEPRLNALLCLGMGFLEIEKWQIGGRMNWQYLALGVFFVVCGTGVSVHELARWRSKRREVRTDN